MKSSIKRFAKVVVVKTIEQFQKLGLKFAVNERELQRLQTRLQADIEKVKDRYREQIEACLASRKEMETQLVEFAKTVKDEKQKKQVFDFVVIEWSVPRGSLVFDNEQGAIAALKTMGLGDLIRVVEEVKKDPFKERFASEPDLMEKTFGARIEKGDPTAKVEVNWQKIGSTFEAEIKAEERRQRAEGLAATA